VPGDGQVRFDEDPPDAIVMDLDMPVMGGLEAAALIRQAEAAAGRARCAMIAMSSHDDPAIAARLKISRHTVKFHVASILTKLAARSRTEAVTLGVRQGLISL